MTAHTVLSRKLLALVAVLFIIANLDTLRAQTAAESAAAQAMDLMNAGRTQEAAAAYEKILKDYPTSTVVSEAQFRLGYLSYLLGDYDKGIEQLKKILGPPAPAEIQELGSALLPQALAAKAGKLPDGDPKRKAGFEDAIKQFDAFIKKYPNSSEVEGAQYGRALCSYQIGNHADAVAALRANLAKFPSSESILDSQYLLALTLATQANLSMQGGNAAQATPAYDEAEKLLRNIIQKHTDIALANDAQFQLGEVLGNRAGFAEKSAQPGLYAQAIAAYRAVEPKEMTAKAQDDRLANLLQRLRAAGVAHNTAEVKRLQALQEREQTKAAQLKAKPDQTVTARIKIAEVFFRQDRNDEARVLLSHMQQFAEDDSQKKEILYFKTLTYVAQNLVDKAVASYDEFQGSYKKDPIAENLPLVIGAMFLSPDPKVNDPKKAIGYFKQALEIYPNNRFANEALTQQASALVQLKRYDEALGTFKNFLAKKPKRELAAAAELGVATIYTQTGKLDEALAAYKTVRDKYAGLPQAEQAAFWVGQTAMQKNDAKTAVAELTAFIAKFPQSQLMPSAMFVLAQAQAAAGNKDAAVAAYKDLAQKFPQSEAAPFSYFQRATIYAGEQKSDEMAAAMREFIEKYPESDKVYFAYDTIGQNCLNTNKLPEAIAAYEEMAQKHAQNPMAPEALLKAGSLWRNYADAQGRYLALNEQQRAEWNKGMSGSTAAFEKLLDQYPDSTQVALALQGLLANQRSLVQSKLKTDAEVETYFNDLAKKFDSKPATKNKTLFTLASFLYEKDKARALTQMTTAYDVKSVYAPADLDLYGTALLEQKKTDEARKVYDKLAADYPNPPGVEPDKVPNQQIQEAQAISLYGIGKCYQSQGNVAEAGKYFDRLKKYYPWSPKMLEASYGIAQSLFEQKKYDEALPLIVQIIRARTTTPELSASALLLGGRVLEEKSNIGSDADRKTSLDGAIDYYIKCAINYENVQAVAAEGLWRGAQLIEKQITTLQEPKKSAQSAKMVKFYKDLAEKYPASPFAEKAKVRLQQLGK
jgi:TolA-binding protein